MDRHDDGGEMAHFDGFDDASLDLLRRLPGFDRDAYAAHKPDIDRLLFDPAKAFVVDLLDALRDEVSPGLEGAPKVNGSISPLNNDLRFAREGTPPYKDHLLVWFWEGASKKASPTLALRIHPDQVGVAGGMTFDKAQVERWRAAIDGEGGVRVQAMLTALGKGRDVAVVGQELKKVPKPFAEDHPRADLLRLKSIQVRWPEPVPKAIGSPRFVAHCAKRLARLEPLHRVLRDEVA